MSIFGRLRNLGRGMWLTRGSEKSALSEAALEAELQTLRTPVQSKGVQPSAEQGDGAPADSAQEGPERDGKGKIVKTL